MNVFINGEQTSLPDDQAHTVALALSIFLNEEQAQTSFAVALNGQFVSKAQYQDTSLQNDDALDVLFPIVGG